MTETPFSAPLYDRLNERFRSTPPEAVKRYRSILSILEYPEYTALRDKESYNIRVQIMFSHKGPGTSECTVCQSVYSHSNCQVRLP